MLQLLWVHAHMWSTASSQMQLQHLAACWQSSCLHCLLFGNQALYSCMEAAQPAECAVLADADMHGYVLVCLQNVYSMVHAQSKKQYANVAASRAFIPTVNFQMF